MSYPEYQRNRTTCIRRREGSVDTTMSMELYSSDSLRMYLPDEIITRDKCTGGFSKFLGSPLPIVTCLCFHGNTPHGYVSMFP